MNSGEVDKMCRIRLRGAAVPQAIRCRLSQVYRGNLLQQNKQLPSV